MSYEASANGEEPAALLTAETGGAIGEKEKEPPTSSVLRPPCVVWATRKQCFSLVQVVFF